MWPSDKPSLKIRVLAAVGLLIGAKVYVIRFVSIFYFILLQLMNVQVPFFFKYAVDYFNKLPDFTTAEGTLITAGTVLLLGCQLYYF